MKLMGLMAVLGAAAALAVPAEPCVRANKYVGTGKCNTRDCHAAEAPKESPSLVEANIWKDKDLHAKAFTQLFKKPSKDIATALGIKDASKSERCTSCHTLIVPKEDVIEGSTWVAQNGVSCEVCHGPGEKWYELHADPKKNSWDHAKSVANGMTDLRDLYTWSNNCVSCHLVIEHDLIEKGHPRLNFELVDYNERMPAHWATKAHPSQAAGFNAKAWAVGAAVSMREAVKNHLTRVKAGAPEAALKESEGLVKAYHAVLKHVADVGDPAPTEALAAKLDGLAKSMGAPGADVAKKIAAEEPVDFDSARQQALALKALAPGGPIETLCGHIAAAKRGEFKLEAYKADLAAARSAIK